MSKNNKIIAGICGAVVVVVAIIAIIVVATNNNNNDQNTNSNNNSSSETPTPTENQTNSIVGVWKYYDPEYPGMSSSIDFIYAFNADGTGTYTMSTSVMPFTYETNGNTLTINYEDSGTFETEFELNGDVLNVKDSSNADTLYKKVK